MTETAATPQRPAPGSGTGAGGPDGGLDDLRRLARLLGEAHRGNLVPGGGDPTRHLDRLARSFSRTYRLLARRRPPPEVRPAAVEWLLDNDYVVQQAVEQVRSALPRGYFRQLPRLAAERGQAEPRVLVLARAALGAAPREASPAAIAEPWLCAYQEVLPLSIGELWAFPALLRLAVLEELAAAVEAMRPEAAGEAAGEPDVGWAIGALRDLAATDWKELFEGTSRVEAILRGDPARAYPGMTFETRDRYRGAVERLARRSPGAGEEAVALEAVRLARAAASREGERARGAHVGTYLVSEGQAVLEAALGSRVPRRRRLGRWLSGYAVPLYLAVVALAWGLALAVPAALLSAWGAGARGLAVGLVLAAAPGLGLAISVVDWLATLVVPPRLLPRMDYEDGLPAEARTLVVMPVIVGRRAEIATLLHRLEIHYLGNPDPRLSFALLTDFADAPRPKMPGDRMLLRAARRGIRELNRRHGGDGRKPFHLLHRDRLWNPAEGRWMGWERKRGKLEELNRLLTGGAKTTFGVRVDLPADLAEVRYVITLDADTHLPPGSASELIGTFAHPLNRPRFETGSGRPAAGYTVLQSRVATAPSAATATRFSRIFAGEAGLDLYTRAVSDVYHDLFGEAVFTGKGIYDVRAFTRALAGRVPENRLLSHDLFEGVHGRVGMVSDVVLYEDFPPNLLLHARRLHRWVRGDWQLLPWLAPRVPSVGGRIASEMSLLDRWKILDNLRRSLFLPSVAALLVAAWLGLDAAPAAIATLGVAGLIGAPMLLGTLGEVRRGLAGRAWRPTLESAAHGAREEAARWALTVTFLAYQSAVVLDAVGRTLYRLAVSRRGLLEWTTAAHAAHDAGARPAAATAWRGMAAAPALAVGVAVALGLLAPWSLPAAAPVLLLWLLSPQAALWASRAGPPERDVLDERQRLLLRRVARRTWHFFEETVGPADHWLPPDHLQEEPAAVPARRTSPTNVGMLVLSTLAAWDLGYLGLRELAARLGPTLDTLERLDRYRGHWYNWYDTRDLGLLEPRYISTVDSGNLAAALLVAGRALSQAPAARVPAPLRLEGLADTVAVLRQTLLIALPAPGREARELAAALARVAEELRLAAGGSLEDRWSALEELGGRRLAELTGGIPALLERHRGELEARRVSDLRAWAGHALVEAGAARQETARLAPWAPLLAQPPAWLAEAPAGSPAASALTRLRRNLGAAPRLRRLPSIGTWGRRAASDLDRALAGAAPNDARVTEVRSWQRALERAFDSAAEEARNLIAELEALSGRLLRRFAEIDFGFLYDPERRLFRIGHDLSAGRPDPNHYDLLASEARLASFLAIAKGDAPFEHWLHLGRPVVRLEGSRVMLSWGGTMFEYLMPPLLQRLLPRTLLDESCRVAVRRQIAFGRRRRIPWGISESGYAELGIHGDYQYRSFGVPGLGLKRDLGDRLVIAPYACLLALRFRPRAVMANVERMIALGALGHYGLVEALDFGPGSRRPLRRLRIVHSFMAHHQGMILVAAANHLKGDPMVRRLHSDPRVAAVDLLLHEQIPQAMRPRILWRRSEAAAAERRKSGEEIAEAGTWAVAVPGAKPHAAVLSNGGYTVLITSAGAGTSRWGETVLTRWRSDPSTEPWGTWIYLADRDTGELWSAAREPVPVDDDACEAVFSAHSVELRRRHGTVHSRVTVAVAPDNLVEIRRVVLTHEGDRPRRLFVCSYAEVVLAAQGEDVRHPAFAKLFVESELRAAEGVLLFRRRLRSPEERPAFLGHTLRLGDGSAPELRWESDRGRFLGRGGSRRAPRALVDRELGLTGTTGATLDPVAALGCAVDLAPGETVEVHFLTAAGPSEAAVLGALRQLSSARQIDLAAERSRIQGEAELHELGIEPALMRRIGELLSRVLAPREGLRSDLAASAGALEPVLWSRGVSGDLPILLVRVRDPGLDLVRQALRAHAWWRRRRIGVDLVLVDEVSRGYERPLFERLERLAAELGRRSGGRGPGRTFVIAAEQLAERLPDLLAAARVVLDNTAGSLDEQLASAERPAADLPRFVPVPGPAPVPAEVPPLERPADLEHDNGTGGFPPEAGAYSIFLTPGQRPPAPWINVVAGAGFGFLVSEAGPGCTWAGNSGENRLTPWHNDPVTDPAGEALYLRDEETAAVWSPTPAPAPAPAPYEVRHSAGRSVFRHRSHGLDQELELLVDPGAPVKLAVLRVRDLWRRPRRLTATYYAEWVLGSDRERTAPFIVPAYDDETGALLAWNRLGPAAGKGVAFLVAGRRPHGVTADRAEFLGPDGDPARPAGLARIGLSGSVRPGLDPCAAVQVHLDLDPGGAVETHFVLGWGGDRDDALALARRFREPAAVEAAARATGETWAALLDTVKVTTPDAGIDRMVNRWLPYQAIACRLWGRTALYQSSGAYGFRDQLQDAANLAAIAPGPAREHLLAAAARQFEEGDVLHWWHPDSGFGVRSRCSDDLLWLPWACARYVEVTGDRGALEEEIPFLTAPPLADGEVERFGRFETTAATASLFEHCLRAIARASTRGPHGLPLIGGGDWNDGMNRLGLEGRGESVWLGWFLCAVLRDFAPICDAAGDPVRGERLREQARALAAALEEHSWDGAWYRRAYDDQGRAIGSASGEECRIDLIAQAWAVLSAAGDPERCAIAMASVRERLLRRDPGLLLLLTPPFDRGDLDPGYIRGYPPGVRENGGQYTHGAVWGAWAFAELGDGDLAVELLRMLLPVERAGTAEGAERYRVEPYVAAADVYGGSGHDGRGGWTWYTGAAGWLYRFAIEGVLGLRRRAGALEVEPCIAREWAGFEAEIREGGAVYEIRVVNPDGVCRGVREVRLDGRPLADHRIPLRDDGERHRVLVRMGEPPPPEAETP